MRIGRDDVTGGIVEVVRLSVLVTAGKWAAGSTVAAEDLFLLGNGDAIPEFGIHSNQANHHITAAGGPVWLVRAGPHQLVLILFGRIDDAIFEPKMISLGTRRPRLVHIAVLAPAHSDVAAGVPKDIAQRVNDGIVLIGANLQS